MSSLDWILGSKQERKAPRATVIEPDRANLPFDKLSVSACDPDTRIFLCAQGKEHYLGACYVSDPLTGADASTVDSFKSALSMPFPAGTFVQIGLISSPDVTPVVATYLDGKNCQNELIRELAVQHALFTKGGVDEPLISRSGVYLNRKQVIITVKTPCRSSSPASGEIDLAKEYADRVQEAFKAGGLHTIQLDAKGYLAEVRRIFNMWGETCTHYDETRPLYEQVLFPGDSINYDDSRTIEFNGGDHYAKVMSVKYFPKRANLSIMNYMIGDPLGVANQITDPFYMVLTMHYPDQVKKIEKVKNRSSMLNHQVFGPTAHLIPALGYKKAGMDILIHEIEGKGSIVCETNLTLFLFSRERERLVKLSSGLQAYFSSLAFEIREDRRVLEALWNNLLPLNTSVEGIKNLCRFHTMGVRHAVQFMPVIGEWTGSGNAGAFMLLSRRGEPALFDLYESSTNYNGIVFAEAGAGKSFFTQKLVSDYLAQGAKVWAIDAGRSYYKLCKASNGLFMEFKSDSNICMNPFTFVDDLDEEMDILKATLAKMAAPEESLSDFQMSLLENAITSTFKRFGTNTTVHTVANFLIAQSEIEAQNLGKQLYPYAGGTYTRWFDGDNNIDMSNDFVVLELSDLKSRKSLQQVVLLQLISRINHDMFNAGEKRKKILIIDEAWELLNDPMMGKAMEALYRKARKEKGAVLIVTQSIRDLYSSPNARAIAENSNWQFVLKQKSESVDSAIKEGNFTIEPYGVQMMKTVHTVPGKYSEVLVKNGDDAWGVFRLVVGRFTQVLFSTKDDERDVIFDAMDHGENVVNAVHDFIRREQLEMRKGETQEEEFSYL